MNCRIIATVAALAFAATLAGCASDPLAAQYANGTNQNYISGDGAYTEIAADQRDAPVEFAGTTDAGDALGSEDFAGSVLVVNFWYAGCPPCRVEAADLKALSEEYASKGVPFIGVNIFDAADVSLTFAREFEIEYPSILDANTASVQLAFAGTVSPNAVPTTLIIDRDGRVAGRISGLIRDPLILSAMIDRVLAEGNSG